MGDVYLAEDTKLNRRVALKFLRPDVAEARDGRARVLREARAAAALNHPNIVHLYSVEEADDLVFITMELVEGRSLRQILSNGTGLPLATTISFATQMADGLACAHAAGIVHRDLKPGNVMVTDGERIKILDFGVAKIVEPISTSDSEGPTTSGGESSGGRAVGTAGYMSPEQALGRPVDARADLFALGVVLFEMATGRAPFQGDTAAAVFDQLLNRLQPSLLTLNPTLPRSLDAIIDKALEKDPDRRYRSAGELLRDLRAVDVSTARSASSAVTFTEPGRSSSIAVLPFVDLSPGKDQEVLLSRDYGGDHQRVDPRSRGARDLANVGLRFSRQGHRGYRDRQKVARGNGSRGKRSQSRRSRSHHCAARECCRRLPDMVEAFRARAIGRLRDSGRDRRRHPGRVPNPSRRSAAGARTQRSRARRVPARDVRPEQVDRRRGATRDRQLQRSHRTGPRLRTCLRSTGRGSSLALLEPGDPAGPRDGATRTAGGRAGPGARAGPRARAQGARADCDEPRLGSKRSGAGADARAPARSGLGLHAPLECLAVRVTRKAPRSCPDRAGRGRAAGSARSAGEDADWLRPPFPSRSRSRYRAVREGRGARAVLRICALRAG